MLSNGLVPEEVSVSRTESFRHNAIAVDPSGTPYIFSGGDLYRKTESSWVFNSVPLSDVSVLPLAVIDPSVLVDSANTVHVFYSEFASSNNHKLFHAECSSTLPDGASCPTPEQIVTRPDERPDFPEFGSARHNSAVVDVDGNLHLVYSYTLGFFGLFYTKRTTDGVWSTPTRVHPGTPNEGYMQVDDVDLRLDPDGRTLHVAFNNRSDFQVPFGVYYGRKSPTGPWVVEPVIQSSVVLQRLAMALDGTTPLIEYPFITSSEIRLATRLSGGGWTQETLFTGASGGVQSIDADISGDMLYVIFDHGSSGSADFRPIYGTQELSSGTLSRHRVSDLGLRETAFVSMAFEPSAIHISYNHNRDSLQYLRLSLVDQSPVAVNDAYVGDAGTILNVTGAVPGVLANDTDANGDLLTAVLVSSPVNGSVTLNSNGSFSYFPKSKKPGTDSFTYVANDGGLDSNVATVTIILNGVNNAPVANDDSFTVAEDSASTNLNVLVNDSILPDSGETLTIPAAGPGSAGGTITIVSGTSIDYTPAADFFGTETFPYTINDGTAGSNDTATVTITVIAVTPVTIDIKPGSFPNSINLGSKGTIPVAIFSTTEFDATTIDPLTLRLADVQVRVRGKGTPMASTQDVNGDGLLDLVVHVETEGLALSPADIVAELVGVTFGGVSIAGSDEIRIVAPLHVAGGPAEGVIVADVLTHATLNPVVQQSLAHWAAAGVEPHRLDGLTQLDVRIADLPDSQLGVAALNIVWFDRDAAGYGWSVNSGGVDLFSAVTHEFGHVLGFRHHGSHDVMGATLGAGVRKLASSSSLRASTPITDPVPSAAWE